MREGVRTNECGAYHGSHETVEMCAHYGGQFAAVFREKRLSPSGFAVTLGYDDKPGSLNSPIPLPLAEHFTEWCERYLLGSGADA